MNIREAINAPQTAEILGMTLQGVHAWIKRGRDGKDGRPKAYDCAGIKVFRRKDVEAYKAQLEAKA
ncbi:hypothetical protein [Aeromonas dhakensis]|uniref:hypothetical protein n=1 Tax=Aeromonas dhakensis TaxID=196024 RepID=UPI0005A69558|nr:hypothetical protein [Aeromonas dhakensis]